MNTVAEKQEQVIGGTTYHVNTPVGVISVLEAARQNATRIRIFYGEHETGRDWMEEHDIMGYVSRTTGNIKVPILIHNARSLGGTAILDHSIVKITSAKKGEVLYQHPKYHAPELFVPYEPDFEGYYMVNTKDDNIARCKTYKEACLLAQFLKGKRNSKGVR